MLAIRLAQLALLGSIWCWSMAGVPIEAQPGGYCFIFLVCSVVEILCYAKIMGVLACMYPLVLITFTEVDWPQDTIAGGYRNLPTYWCALLKGIPNVIINILDSGVSVPTCQKNY